MHALSSWPGRRARCGGTGRAVVTLAGPAWARHTAFVPATALITLAAVALTACSSAPQAAPAPAAPAAVARPAPASTAPAAVPNEPGLVLPVVTAPKPVPVYPMDMLRARQHGLVYIECVVDEAGRVVTTSVRDGGDVAFNDAAEETVRHWTFKPGTRDGVPIPMRVLVPIEYIDKQVSTLP